MSHPARDPLVSVVIPAWNAEETLLETLESVAAQTYRNVEIIIVDDGSTDSTADIAREFCACEPRARLVRKENGGLSSARNFGIEHTKGEWIAPIDADDLWHPTRLEKQVEAALVAPLSPGLVYCWYQTIDEQGYVLGSGPRWSFDGSALKRMAYVNPVQNGSGLLLSRRAVLSVGGYDMTLRACEDVMIQLEIARSHVIAAVPEHLVGYRKRSGGMSRDAGLVIRSWREVHRRLVQEAAEIPPQVLRWTEAFFDWSLAEQHVTAGSYRQARRPLLRAVRHDPPKMAAYLAYRLARTAVRLARGRRRRPEPVHFYDLDPRALIPWDPDELPRLAALLRRIDERRLRRLARSERLEVRARQAVL